VIGAVFRTPEWGELMRDSAMHDFYHRAAELRQRGKV
jgi:hypothetical protein